MTALSLYVLTFVVFLGIDFFGLSYLIKPVFERDIGHLLTDSPRLFPAFLFYAFFIGAVTYFVSWPALQQGESVVWVFMNAAILGAMAYGTYEFTNLATLKDWTSRMVLVDFSWGTLLTGMSATIGTAVIRNFSA